MPGGGVGWASGGATRALTHMHAPTLCSSARSTASPASARPPSQGKDKPLAANIARFAFCKDDETLFEAARRLQGLRRYLRDPSIIASLPPLPVKPEA